MVAVAAGLHVPPYDAVVDRLVTAHVGPAANGLDVEPFRGLRYSAAAVGDLAGVTSPPYDVVDAAGVRTLESTNEHNVVRLILPRDDDCGPEGRYRHAAATLHAWIADGTLLLDTAPGLYVYEQVRVGQVLQRGIIGAVALHDPADLVILPHEETMPGPVADGLELMRAGDANIEPIFLVYNGGEGAAAALVEVVAGPPLITAQTDDGIEHRLWAVTGGSHLETLRGDLSSRTAMIADGHHRYAAYRALQAERRAARGPGPWDFGLALLVDLSSFPPAVGAIHRSIAGLAISRAVELALAAGFAERASGTAFDLTKLEPVAPGEWVLVDGVGTYVRLVINEPQDVAPYLPRDRSEQWRNLDTAVLHHALIEGIWRVDEAAVAYHHSAAGALSAATDEGSVAVLMAPVDVATVFELAAAGETMPRKSTSFGPKPRTGWVLRTFDS